MMRWLSYSICFTLLLMPQSNAEEELEDSKREVVADERPIVELPITAADRDHWAFQPLVKPAVPTVADANQQSNSAVDWFVLEKLAKKQLALASAADHSTLLRRVTFDLTGLPPTLGERSAFLDDSAPDAYERVVDRLLASPAHGEHAGQAWLDLARFAETDGFEHDKVRPLAWKYRDWVIRALNDDLPYDRFLQLQLAGDEILPGDEQARIATGFCLAGPDMPDVNDQQERRHNLLNEMTGMVSSVIIGLQLGCAQCHDHKYDALSQADFFRLRACFEPAVQLKKDQSVEWLKEVTKPEKSRLWIRGDHRRPGAELQPDVPRIANLGEQKFVALISAVASSSSAEAKSTYRRAAAARWFTQPDHPLTARVMANRLWQQHFGRGLSASPSDFGLLGESPTHPELLDYLATEFTGRDWSMKTLRRTIVESAVYRQASHSSGKPIHQAEWQTRLAKDSGNQLFSRYPRRRLDGEMIRDAMLAAAGMLDARAGGPGVMPPLPPELTSTLLKNQWQTSKREADHYRRSVYLFARRNLRYPLFEAFDRPDANASCPSRIRSTTAPQALLMLNSDQVLQTAQQIAGKIDPHHAPRDLVLKILSRDATAVEITALQQFISEQATMLARAGRADSSLALPSGWQDQNNAPTGAAIVQAALALLNSSEMIYLD
ncbi:hypothetical protein ETAA8_49790 [Anatilimnocola aggregata]|uniref:DUF1553 domain-containing protein n=1 Tax=Anatilimnocola aggregata TaxID=2528021 RepID=A0A517YI05_9BACT|nr:DUF1549 and DUF1553 domain-containing protein [Anatilimnocola aggregata]QDU29863.1 hypothetical protein ETAA8_49790 [Anatilimnocola aggregata]